MTVSPAGSSRSRTGSPSTRARYDRLARALNAAGFLVHATDHRGHGRSVESAEGLGHFGAPGFDGLIADVSAFGGHLDDVHPELPLFLLAHSMGSFAAQSVILDFPMLYAGVVLSGSTAIDALAAAMAADSAAGGDGPSGLEAFNAGFEHRTGYEWLSRDEAEVDAYVADPLCGFDVPEDTMGLLFGQAGRLADPDSLSALNPDLPLLIASGEADPLVRQR